MTCEEMRMLLATLWPWGGGSGEVSTPKMSTHQHCCGLERNDYTGKVYFDPVGCGHVWTHRGKPGPFTRYRARRHMCPSCKAGPWALQYDELKFGDDKLVAAALAKRQSQKEVS